MPVASFCASETAETGRIANGREQGDHVSRRQESYKVFCPTFCTLQKVGKSCREAAKGLILLVGSCCLCGLNRGLENLDSPFGKVLILFVRSRHCGELNRGSQNLETSRKGTVLFFSLVRKERGVPQRFANLWTPGRIQSSIEEDFSRASGGTCPNPAFRTRRQRKGFESVRGSGVTA